MSRSRHGKNWTERGVIANPRGFHKPDEQSTEEQDKVAPFPARDPQLPHDPFNCPDPLDLHCEQARRRAIARARLGIPGLSPEPDDVDALGVPAGEPVPLVEQSKKAERDYGSPS